MGELVMRLNDISERVKNRKLRNDEDLINLLEFKELFKVTEEIEQLGCIITPYYVHNDMVYELYQYEFLLDENEKSFEEYILKTTGKKRLEDVNIEVRELRKRCFCNDFHTASKKIIEWFDFILDNNLICEEIKGVYGEYNSSNLYVMIY